MPSVEQIIKKQYAKVFKKNDWEFFKIVAEYYFKKAATLKKADIDSDEVFKLAIRNIQKRLFLGIACELVVKSCYLKQGYVINKPITKGPNLPIKFKDIKISELDAKDTYTLSPLIQNINKIIDFSNWAVIQKGLNILKVFRNKEGHVAVMWHKYDPGNYRDIEASVIAFYLDVFGEQLDFRIAMESKERGKFEIRE